MYVRKYLTVVVLCEKVFSQWCGAVCQVDTGSAVRALESLKNGCDQLFRESVPETKEAKQAKSAVDSQFAVVATKLKKEANYHGNAADLVYSNVSGLFFVQAKCR